jgi:micrococcal nuclease
MPTHKPKRRRLASLGFILVVVILVLTLRLTEDIGFEKLPGERFVVARVIDGDTVELLGGDKLRLLSIDTPEKGEALHDEATDFLAKLALGKKSRIEYSKTRRDRYGRLLGFLYIDDTLFANRQILDSGYGYLYLFDDQELNLPQVRELLRAQRKAVEGKIGLWAREREPEEFYVTIQSSHRFHRPGCKSISESDSEKRRVFETKQEALFEGLSPCRNCHP